MQKSRIRWFRGVSKTEARAWPKAPEGEEDVG